MDRITGPFVRMVLVRAIREDRTGVACADFINVQLDPKYTAPVTDAIADIFEESLNRKPVLYLLTAGSDPTMNIDELAKKRKKFPTEKVSMGEGQDSIGASPIVFAVPAKVYNRAVKRFRSRG